MLQPTYPCDRSCSKTCLVSAWRGVPLYGYRSSALSHIYEVIVACTHFLVLFGKTRNTECRAVPSSLSKSLQQWWSQLCEAGKATLENLATWPEPELLSLFASNAAGHPTADRHVRQHHWVLETRVSRNVLTAETQRRA